MRSFVLFSGIMLIALSVKAQAIITPSVLSTAGFYFSDPLIPITLSVTIGEPLVTTQTNENLTLTRGFQQPNDIISGNLDGEDAIIKIGPNPTKDNIEVWVESFKGGGTYFVEVFDVLGREMYLTADEREPFRANGPHKKIYLEHLAAGVYLIKVSSVNSQFTKSFKLNKI